MSKSIFQILVIFCVFLTASCTKESIVKEVEPKPNSNSEEQITLYLADTDEVIHLNSMDDLKDVLLLPKYSQMKNAKENMARFEAFQKELSYSKTLDLEDEAVTKAYEEYLWQEYGTADSRLVEGILYDGQGTGFLSVTTTVPLNLKSSKRNRASSWQPIIGFNVLCERTWWRGRKVVVLGAVGPLINLADLDFNNETDSYF
jgi:hypothetical protein